MRIGGNEKRSPQVLSVAERVPLFCVASNTDWKHSAIPGEIVTTMVVKGLIERAAGGALSLTDRARPPTNRA
jgi:hypothetical protein